MSDLSRTGVSIDSDLLDEFNRFIEKQGYTNRSEAFRDLIRDRLVSTDVKAPNAEVVRSITGTAQCIEPARDTRNFGL